MRQQPNLIKKAFQFLLNVIPIGESAYTEFLKGRLEEKFEELLDNISKTRIPTKLLTKKKNIIY